MKSLLLVFVAATATAMAAPNHLFVNRRAFEQLVRTGYDMDLASEPSVPGPPCPGMPPATPLPATPPPAIMQAIQAFKKAALATTNESSTLGVSATLSYGGNVLASVAAGLANRANATPVTPSTLFRVGSVTKIFTAIIVYQAASAGKISLDDAVSKTVPDFQPKNIYPGGSQQGSTWRQLLQQRSGLQREAPFGFNTTDAMLQAVSETFLIEQPGGRPSYSNLGFSLLGHLVAERLYGSTYADVVRSGIVQPLGLENTGVEYTQSVFDRLAVSYTSQGAALPFGSLGWSSPAGEMYSTPEDLAAVSWALIQAARGTGPFAPSISVAIARDFLDPDFLNPDGQTVFGAPWESRNHEQFTVRRKGGNVAGYSTLMSFIPEIDLSISASWNWQGSDEYSSSLALWDAVLPDFVSGLQSIAPSGINPGPSPLDYTGEYLAAVGIQLNVRYNLTGQGGLIFSLLGESLGVSLYANQAPAAIGRNDTFAAYIPPGLLPCLQGELLGLQGQLLFFTRDPSTGNVVNASIPGMIPGVVFQRQG